MLHNTAAAVDELMERASAALARMDYFETETLAMKAMKRARAANDFERMARICLPLQEGRRQRREAALDSGRRFILRAMPPRNAPPESGCYLLEPPLIGLQGREFRDFAERKGVAVLALVREPTTKAGKWPIVAVGGGQSLPVVARVQVDPPAESPPETAWFIAAQEAAGDAAIKKVNPAWPADHRVDDLLEYLEAVPDHEKLIQALERTCREAAQTPPSAQPRRRGMEDPFSF